MTIFLACCVDFAMLTWLFPASRQTIQTCTTKKYMLNHCRPIRPVPLAHKHTWFSWPGKILTRMTIFLACCIDFVMLTWLFPVRRQAMQTRTTTAGRFDPCCLHTNTLGFHGLEKS
jgi:hypothetical protein